MTKLRLFNEVLTVLETFSSVCEVNEPRMVLRTVYTHIYLCFMSFRSAAGRKASAHEHYGFHLVLYCISVTLHVDAVSFSNQQKILEFYAFLLTQSFVVFLVLWLLMEELNFISITAILRKVFFFFVETQPWFEKLTESSYSCNF